MKCYPLVVNKKTFGGEGGKSRWLKLTQVPSPNVSLVFLCKLLHFPLYIVIAPCLQFPSVGFHKHNPVTKYPHDQELHWT